MNLTKLKEVQIAKETAASKMKRPELLTSLSKTVKSSLKPVSSSMSTSSPTSFNSLPINNPINCDKDALQEGMTLSSNVQLLMQDVIPEDNLIIDDPTLTQDSTPTDCDSNRNYSGDTVQCSNSSASHCDTLSKLSSSSTSYRHTIFKEQLHDKDIGNFVTIRVQNEC